MSGTLLSGAENALQNAILGELRNSPLMRDIFGPEPRIVDDFGGARPAYPYLQIAKHGVRYANAVGAKLKDHTIDLQVMTRWRGRTGARDAVSLVQTLVDDANLTLDGHKLVWCYAAFADTLMLRDLSTFKGVIRIKARTTPLEI